jgi:Recombinase/Recombinase zinc beta ribbon domain
VSATTRITSKGGRLIGEDLDTQQPMAKAMLGFLAGWAEEERDARRAGWAVAVQTATERGIHVGPTPTGYNRDGEGRLVPDTYAAPHIHVAFQMRANRRSLQEIADYLADHEVYPTARRQKGNGDKKIQRKRWTRAGVAAMLRSRAYVGEAFHGATRKQSAHTKIVSEDVWQQAQLEGPKPKHDGTVAAHGMLLGVAICAGCGGKLQVNASGPQGNRQTNYYCRDPKTRQCTAPASIRTAVIDKLVEPELLKRLAKKSGRTAAKRAEAKAHATWHAAEQELETFLAIASVTRLGERYNTEVERRQIAVNEAVIRWSDAKAKSSALSGVVDPKDWVKIDMKQKRHVAASLIEAVEIKQAKKGKGGGRHQPVEQRYEVRWAA